jgi:hypothetical protein
VVVELSSIHTHLTKKEEKKTARDRHTCVPCPLETSRGGRRQAVGSSKADSLRSCSAMRVSSATRWGAMAIGAGVVSLVSFQAGMRSGAKHSMAATPSSTHSAVVAAGQLSPGLHLLSVNGRQGTWANDEAATAAAHQVDDGQGGPLESHRVSALSSAASSSHVGVQEGVLWVTPRPEKPRRVGWEDDWMMKWKEANYDPRKRVGCDINPDESPYTLGILCDMPAYVKFLFCLSITVTHVSHPGSRPMLSSLGPVIRAPSAPLPLQSDGALMCLRT